MIDITKAQRIADDNEKQEELTEEEWERLKKSVVWSDKIDDSCWEKPLE